MPPDPLAGGLLLRALLGAVGLLLALAFSAAGYALFLRRRNEATRRRWDALEARWTPRLLAILEDPGEADRVTAELPPRDRLPFIQVLLRFARRLSGAEREALERAATPHLHLLRTRLRHPRVEERARAVQTLAELALDRHRAEVTRALRDPAPLVRLAAAQGLARGGTEADAEALVTGIEAFAGWRRSFVAATLAELGPAAIPVLLRALEDESGPPVVRALAAAALARLHPAEAVPAAVRAADSSDDVDLLVGVMDLLGEVGDPSALPAVERHVDDPRESVRGAALQALARLAPPGSRDARLRKALIDPSAFVALRAARGLVRSGAVPLLREAAMGEGRAAQVARHALEVGA